MSGARPLRALWLVSHTTARRFDVAMLKRSGVPEIFLPKVTPSHVAFRSGSVDWEEDKNLTIPPEELALLNATDWQGNPSPEAWDVANRRFDLLFSIFFSKEEFETLTRNFQGAVLWRAFGSPAAWPYAKQISHWDHVDPERVVRSLGERFWFAQGYEHLHRREPPFLAERRVDLPLGLADARPREGWTGEDKRVFFVCPDIGCNAYYEAAYRDFKRDFAGLDYAVGGSQPVQVRDPRVLGFVTAEEHQRNMRRFRVMYYHSQEPDHIQYHPFEAVRAGMPVVFMAGGMLDQLGGRDLPGRARNVKEARTKLSRVLDGDRAFIERLRATQRVLLERMEPENLAGAWKAGIQKVVAGLERARSAPPPARKRRTKVAVLLPAGYRGGSLEGAKLLARALEAGGRRAGEETEVVLGHLDEPGLYSREDFADLPPGVKPRPYRWRLLSPEEAARAASYRGLKRPLEDSPHLVPEDGLRQFMDCDPWVVVSDRLEQPLLPLRDYVVMSFDFLQRYQRLWSHRSTERFMSSAHRAKRVWVTSEFTRRDALDFAGLAEAKVVKLPVILPDPAPRPSRRPEGAPYFIWTTNLGPQKNHERAFLALRAYYEELNGRLDCRVTGTGTSDLLRSPQAHLRSLPRLVGASPKLRSRLHLMGELPPSAYQETLAGAEFLWHPALIDNGTFTVVEAAQHGVPSLSSGYPAMRSLDELLGLKLSWQDPEDPRGMAEALKAMEERASALKGTLPGPEALKAHGAEAAGAAYWRALEECR